MNLQLTPNMIGVLTWVYEGNNHTRLYSEKTGAENIRTIGALKRRGLICDLVDDGFLPVHAWTLTYDGMDYFNAAPSLDDSEDEQQPPAVVTLAADEFHDGMGRGYCPCCLNTCFYTEVGGTGKDYGLKHSASSGAKDGFRKEAIYGEFIFEKPGVVYWHCSYEGEDYETFDNALSLMLDDIAYIKAQISQPAPATDEQQPPALSVDEQLAIAKQRVVDLQDAPEVEFQAALDEVARLKELLAPAPRPSLYVPDDEDDPDDEDWDEGDHNWDDEQLPPASPSLNQQLSELEERLELTEEQWLELTEGDNGFQDFEDDDPDDEDWDEGDHNWDDDDLRPYPDTPLTHNRLIPNSPGEFNGVDTEFQSALADLFCNKMVIFIHADGEIRVKPRRGGNAAVSA